MKKLTIYAFAFTTLFLTSCGGSDEPGAGGSSTPAIDESIPITGKFTKNVLIEDYTGTWCQFCPRVIYGIQKVEAENLKAFPVAIHRGSNGSDPYHFAAATDLENSIGLTGYPTAMLNRKTNWNNETSTSEVKNKSKQMLT